MSTVPPPSQHGKHRRILPELKDQKQRSGGPVVRIVDPSKVESLLREILNRIGLSGTQRMISFWLQGCHPYKNDDFPCTKSRVPDYWPPGCRYVSPTKLNALESQIVSLRLLRAGLQFRDAQFDIEHMEESTINIISGYPKDFYHDAPILINSLYEARRQEIRWNLKGISNTATHVSAEILMPIPNTRKRTSIKKAIQFDLQLPDDIEGYIGQVTSRESSSVAPCTPELRSESNLHKGATKATAVGVTACSGNVYGNPQSGETERGPQDPPTENQKFSRSPVVDSTNTPRDNALSVHDPDPPFAPGDVVYPEFGAQAISPNSQPIFNTPHNAACLLNEAETPRVQSTTSRAGVANVAWNVKGEQRFHPQGMLLLQPDNDRIDNVYAKGYNAEPQTSGSYSMDFVPAAAPDVPAERTICAFCQSAIGERSKVKSTATLLRNGQQMPQAAFPNLRFDVMSRVAVPLQTWSNEAIQSLRSAEGMSETW